MAYAVGTNRYVAFKAMRLVETMYIWHMQLELIDM